MLEELYKKMEALLDEIIENEGYQEKADGADQMMTLVKNYLESITAPSIDVSIVDIVVENIERG